MSNNNVRITGIAGLVLASFAIVFGEFFIATKAPAHVAFFHGATPEIILAGLFNWLLCHLAVSNGGWNMFRREVVVVSITLAVLITGIDLAILHNLLL